MLRDSEARLNELLLKIRSVPRWPLETLEAAGWSLEDVRELHARGLIRCEATATLDGIRRRRFDPLAEFPEVSIGEHIWHLVSHAGPIYCIAVSPPTAEQCDVVDDPKSEQPRAPHADGTTVHTKTSSELLCPELPELQKYDAVAWRLYKLQGMKQEDVAKALETEYGVPFNQGGVSRMIGRAQRYAKAGGILDKLPDPPKRAKPVDPDTLDMGVRQDGLTPRQRPQRQDD